MSDRTPNRIARRHAGTLAGFMLNPFCRGSVKRKLAPRSSLQFKVGPQFTPTVSLKTILNSHGSVVKPLLFPRIDRGFEIIENEWVGYKRNYFTLVSSFTFQGVRFEEFAGDRYHFSDLEPDSTQTIMYFGIRLVAQCVDDGSSVNLIQHTAKRDRGPQFTPPVHPAVPSRLPDHDIIKEAANVRNTNKIARLNEVFFFDRHEHDHESFDISGLEHYPDEKIIKVARYERVQFSASINYKKPALSSKRFKLLFQLVGFTDMKKPEEFVVLAFRETPPLIIRGRSPSNYSESMSAEVNEDIPFMSQFSHEALGEMLEDDLNTFEILKEANDQMDLEPLQTEMTKKKRGRKPKTKPSVPHPQENKSEERKLPSQKKPKYSKDSNGATKKKTATVKSVQSLKIQEQRNILSEISFNPTPDAIPEKKPTWTLTSSVPSFRPFIDEDSPGDELQLADFPVDEPGNASLSSTPGLTDLFDNPFGVSQREITRPRDINRYSTVGPSLSLTKRNLIEEIPFEQELQQMRNFTSINAGIWEIDGHLSMNDLPSFDSKPSEALMANFDEFPSFSAYI
jgi:meiosis-specific transcription factor NDT80